MACSNQTDSQGFPVVVCDGCGKPDTDETFYHTEDDRDLCSCCLESKYDANAYQNALAAEARMLLDRPDLTLARQVRDCLSIYED